MRQDGGSEKKQFHKSAQKSEKESFIVVLYYRKISIRITRVLVKTNVTPDQITLLSFSLALFAATLFAFGDYLYLIIGAILLQLSIIFDCVDGEIARIKSLQSKRGEMLDGLLDKIKQTFLFCGIGYGIYVRTNYMWIWILILLTVASYHLISIIELKKKSLTTSETVKEKRNNNKDEGLTNNQRKFNLGPGQVSETLITIGALLNRLVVIVIILAVLVNAYTIYALTRAIRKTKD